MPPRADRCRRARRRQRDRPRAALGRVELPARRAQGVAGRRHGRPRRRRRPARDQLRLLEARRQRVPRRASHVQAHDIGRHRHAVRGVRRRDRVALRTDAPTTTALRSAASTRCSRRTCSSCGSTPVRATRTPAPTSCPTAGCCCSARCTRSASPTSRGAATVAARRAVRRPARRVRARRCAPARHRLRDVAHRSRRLPRARAGLRAVRHHRRHAAAGPAGAASTTCAPRSSRRRRTSTVCIAGDGTPREAERRRVRVLLVPAAVRGRRRERRRTRLDGAARQPRPLPVPRTGEGHARRLLRRNGGDVLPRSSRERPATVGRVCGTEPARSPGWSEWWLLDYASGDGFGGFVRLALYPEPDGSRGTGRTW